MEGPHGAAGVGGDHRPLRPRRNQLRPPFGQPLFVGVFLVEGPAPAAGFRTAAPRCVGRRRAVRLDSGRADRLPRYGGFAVGALRRRVEGDVGRRVGRLSARRVLRRTRPRPAAYPAAYPAAPARQDVRLRHSCRYAQPRMGGETGAVGAGGHRSGECRLPFGRRRRGHLSRDRGAESGHVGLLHGRHAARKDGRPDGRRHFRSGGRLDTSRHGRIRSGHVGLRRRVRVVQAPALLAAARSAAAGRS